MNDDKYKLDKPETCVLCGVDMTHSYEKCNPEPLARYEDGQCCRLCDNTKVTPARIELAVSYYKEK